jgi:hypothetical protein
MRKTYFLIEELTVKRRRLRGGYRRYLRARSIDDIIVKAHTSPERLNVTESACLHAVLEP